MQLSKQDLENNSDKVYDTLIVGGGAGGLSAGIYLQRFRLSSVIVDKGKARSFWIQELNNYLGQPPGTPGKELIQKGKKHYLSFDSDFLNGYVDRQGQLHQVPTPVNHALTSLVKMLEKSSA
jgi:thioredoxin reductase (NADPH)